MTSTRLPLLLALPACLASATVAQEATPEPADDAAGRAAREEGDRAALEPAGRWGELLAEVGGSFSSGDYETDDTIDIWQAYLRLGYAYGRVEAAVTVPYLRIDGVGGATAGGGGIIPLEAEEFAAISGQPGQPGQPGPPGQPASSEPGADDTEQGLGDVRLELRLRVVETADWAGPDVDLIVEVKAPTADEDDGLGTGEWDGGGGVGLTHALDRWVLSADLRLLAVGEPDGADFAPVVFVYQFSAGYSVPAWEGGALTPFAFVGGQTAVAAGTDPPLEVGAGAFVVHRALEGSLALSAGLTDGSPDVRVAVGLGLRWGAR